MVKVTRVSEHGGNPMVVRVDRPADGDGGFLEGGTFHFAPAGQEGSVHHMTEYAAGVIAHDPGLAEHFEFDPPVGPAVAAPAGE